jgi:truncated hemoglobin YjbI
MSESLDAKSLLERFDILPEDLVLLKRCGDSFGLSDKIHSVVEQFYEWLGEQPEFSIFFNSPETVQRVKKLQNKYWQEFFSGVVDQKYVDYRVLVGEVHAQRDTPNLIYFAAMAHFNKLFSDAIVACDFSHEDTSRAFTAFDKLRLLDMFVASRSLSLPDGASSRAARSCWRCQRLLHQSGMASCCYPWSASWTRSARRTLWRRAYRALPKRVHACLSWILAVLSPSTLR